MTQDDMRGFREFFDQVASKLNPGSSFTIEAVLKVTVGAGVVAAAAATPQVIAPGGNTIHITNTNINEVQGSSAQANAEPTFERLSLDAAVQTIGGLSPQLPPLVAQQVAPHVRALEREAARENPNSGVLAEILRKIQNVVGAVATNVIAATISSEITKLFGAP